MNTSSYSALAARPAHAGTILAMPVLPEGVKAPFGHAWGHLNPGARWSPHAPHARDLLFPCRARSGGDRR